MPQIEVDGEKESGKALSMQLVGYHKTSELTLVW